MKLITLVIPVDPEMDEKKIKPFDKLDSRVKILKIYGKNPSKNRNEGINKSKTKFVAFTNAHSKLDSTWVDEALNLFKQNKEIDIIGGPQYTPKDSSKFEKESGYALSSIFGAAGASKRYSGNKIIFDADETSITSANLISRKEVLSKVKFDENLYPGEDPKFISDAKSLGFSVVFNPRLKAYNKRRSDLSSLSKQIFNYGRTRPIKESFLQTLKRPYFLVPLFFVAYLLSISLWFAISPLLIIPLAFYMILLIFFSIYESIKNKDAVSMLTLPFIFVTIHMSYGLGYLFGILRK